MNKLPSEWEVKELGELLNYEQPTKYLVKNENYNERYNIPVLTAGKSFILGYTNEKESIYSNLPVIIFDDFTTTSKYVDFPFKVKSSAMKILKQKENISLKFIYEIMQLINFSPLQHQRHWISIYSKIKIPIPKSLQEQQKIAEILSEVDKSIEITKKIIEKEKKVKKGLLQKMLNVTEKGEPEIRFPEFSGKWMEKRLGEIGKFYLGLTYTPQYVKKGIPFLSVKDIVNGKIDFKYIKYISKKEFDEITNNAKPKKDDILFGRVGTLGNGIIVETSQPFAIFVSLGFIRVYKNYSNIFIKEWINSNFFKKQVNSLVAGSSQKNLNVGWLKNFKIYIPPTLEEQQKIAEVLSAQDEKIEKLNKKLNKLKKIKKALMQDLLTGKVRVTKLLKDRK